MKRGWLIAEDYRHVCAKLTGQRTRFTATFHRTSGGR